MKYIYFKYGISTVGTFTLLEMFKFHSSLLLHYIQEDDIALFITPLVYHIIGYFHYLKIADLQTQRGAMYRELEDLLFSEDFLKTFNLMDFKSFL